MRGKASGTLAAYITASLFHTKFAWMYECEYLKYVYFPWAFILLRDVSLVGTVLGFKLVNYSFPNLQHN